MRRSVPHRALAGTQILRDPRMFFAHGRNEPRQRQRHDTLFVIQIGQLK